MRLDSLKVMTAGHHARAVVDDKAVELDWSI